MLYTEINNRIYRIPEAEDYKKHFDFDLKCIEEGVREMICDGWKVLALNGDWTLEERKEAHQKFAKMENNIRKAKILMGIDL